MSQLAHACERLPGVELTDGLIVRFTGSRSLIGREGARA
jgi:hypothetical protein